MLSQLLYFVCYQLCSTDDLEVVRHGRRGSIPSFFMWCHLREWFSHDSFWHDI